MFEKRPPWRAVLIACAAIQLTGCGPTAYAVDPTLVSRYVAPEPPQPDETLVYVIRGRALMGSNRDVWIAVNDRVVGKLENQAHLLIKVKSGVNTVHVVQQLAGFAFTAVDNRPGETVFLSLEYTKGSMQEVPRDLGITMVMKTHVAQLLPETRENTGYDEGLLNPGRLGLDLMRPSMASLSPDANSAVVTFFRTKELVEDVAFDVWDEAS